MTKWYQEYPTPQDKRSKAPKVAKPRSRKDRKRWCGGHVGREHQIVVAIPPNRAGRVRNRKVEARLCHEAPDWYLQTRMFKEFGRDWFCQHVTMCTVCGRLFGPIPWQQCPDRP